MTLRGLVCGSLAVLVIALAARVRSGPSEAVAPVAVTIVPTSSGGRSGDAIELFGDSHFHVVVTNSSGAPIKLWKEWCSWGYFSLSFEARDASGRSFVISKKVRGWDKNFPCPIVVGPGRPWVIDVNLDPSIWQNSPLSSDAGKATLRLKAVFEIRKDESSEKEGVWTGRVSSPEAQYTLYWPGAAAKDTAR